jgi:integrase
MPLTDTAIRNVKPRPKPFKMFDEKGMYLLVTPSKGKWFRLKYRINCKENQISLGVYPDVSLKDARDRRDAARKLLASGIDPSQDRKRQKSLEANQAASTFEAVTREWLDKNSGAWVPAHAERKIRLFERDIFPALGKRPVAEIEPPDVLDVLQRIEARGAHETAKRAHVACAQVFRYSVATRRIKSDPSRDLRGALAPVQTEHFAATTDPKKLAGILRALDSYDGTTVVRCALRLAPLVFVRPGELRKAEWKDIDLDAAEWRFTVTKTLTPHIVPLSRQAVAILREVSPITGQGQLVFPSARSSKRPMSDNAVLSAMRRMDISPEVMTGHGFRAVARTLLDEVLQVRVDLIEHQLAHAVKDPNGRAYNRTAFLSERREMMQQWADYLDTLKADSAGSATV